MNTLYPFYHAARNHSVFIDFTAETGWLKITGTDALSWLQALVSQDLRSLAQTEAVVQSFILQPTGQLLSSLDFYFLTSEGMDALSFDGSDHCILAAMPLSQLNSVWNVLQNYLINEDVELDNVTQSISMVSLQGPEANSREYPFPSYLSDHTGSSGYDFLLPYSALQKILSQAANPVMDAAHRELLRIEAALPAWGQEWTESLLAQECDPLGKRYSTSKGCYIGQEIVARIASRGHTNRSLAGLVMNEIPINSLLHTAEGKEAGRITSTAPCSPAAEGKHIALAYIRNEYNLPESTLMADSISCQISPIPFYRSSLRASQG